MQLLKRELEAEIDQLVKRKKQKASGQEDDRKKDKRVNKKSAGAQPKLKFKLCNIDYKAEKDFTKEGLDMLALLDQQATIATTKKIQEHNMRHKRHQKLDTAKKKKEPEGSLFTDEDFEAVSRMHFVNSQKVVFKDE